MFGVSLVNLLSGIFKREDFDSLCKGAALAIASFILDPDCLSIWRMPYAKSDRVEVRIGRWAGSRLFKYPNQRLLVSQGVVFVWNSVQTMVGLKPNKTKEIASPAASERDSEKDE